MLRATYNSQYRAARGIKLRAAHGLKARAARGITISAALRAESKSALRERSKVTDRPGATSLRFSTRHQRPCAVRLLNFFANGEYELD
jgi:hypothetical protein